jgi:hypothetical protein
LSEGAAAKPGSVGASLASLESGHHPAIHRTHWAFEFQWRTGKVLDLGPEAEHVQWWSSAAEAVAGIAALCWAPVPSEVRALVMDEDDLGPFFSRYIPATRVGSSAAVSSTAFREPGTLAALRSLGAAAVATPSCQLAAISTNQLDEQDMLELTECRERIETTIGETIEPGLTGETVLSSEAARRMVLADGYRGASFAVQAAVAAVQQHNELVNHVLWVLLGIAEQREAPTVLAEIGNGPLRQQRDGRHVDIRITLHSSDVASLRPIPAPLIIQAGLPSDGVYLIRAYRSQWSGGTHTDITARRLAALEIPA